jgi:hypothetical protein
LFTAEAMPVWVGGTDDMTALVSGATARVSPQPRRITGGLRFSGRVLEMFRQSGASGLDGMIRLFFEGRR